MILPRQFPKHQHPHQWQRSKLKRPCLRKRVLSHGSSHGSSLTLCQQSPKKHRMTSRFTQLTPHLQEQQGKQLHHPNCFSTSTTKKNDQKHKQQAAKFLHYLVHFAELSRLGMISLKSGLEATKLLSLTVGTKRNHSPTMS